MTSALTLKHISLSPICGTVPMWSAISFSNYRDQEQMGSLERLM